ncbi:hypothetical protein [Microbacterium luteum]|uniref:hypothetical protein n=1 Tax=Microbacterium luteum TaxID=2782167 RepID=UPI00188927EB|nr:hypothetical protein [Microbacterium luteum]
MSKTTRAKFPVWATLVLLACFTAGAAVAWGSGLVFLGVVFSIGSFAVAAAALIHERRR